MPKLDIDGNPDLAGLFPVWDASQGLADYIKRKGKSDADPQIIRAQIQLISARFESSLVKTDE